MTDAGFSETEVELRHGTRLQTLMTYDSETNIHTVNAIPTRQLPPITALTSPNKLCLTSHGGMDQALLIPQPSPGRRTRKHDSVTISSGMRAKCAPSPRPRQRKRTCSMDINDRNMLNAWAHKAAHGRTRITAQCAGHTHLKGHKFYLNTALKMLVTAPLCQRPVVGVLRLLLRIHALPLSLCLCVCLSAS